MNFNFFHPVRQELFEGQGFVPAQIGHQISKQTEDDFYKAKICIIGFENGQYQNEADAIRKALYAYYGSANFPKIFDLGNVITDFLNEANWKDFYQIINQCRELGQTLCFIGGQKHYLFDIQMAYAQSKAYTNLGVIDKAFSVEDAQLDTINNDNFLYKICAQSPSYLFNIIAIGYQQYLVNPKNVAIFKQLNFEEYRLGQVRDNIAHSEPYLRDLDILGVSIDAMKQAETGGQRQCSPNGLYSEELAQMMRYAGMSDQLSSIGFFDYNSLDDPNNTCNALIAQAIWCFLEGFGMRLGEQPTVHPNSFLKYTLHNEEMALTLTFLKSKRSGRWWVEMPADKALLQQRFYIPCSLEDYEVALDGDIPERWLKGFNKLSQSPQA